MSKNNSADKVVKKAKTIPAFYTDKNKTTLKKLGYTDFPTTKEGKTAHLEYRILNYTNKITECKDKIDLLAKEPSTLDKLSAKRDAIESQIKAKEAELASIK